MRPATLTALRSRRLASALTLGVALMLGLTGPAGAGEATTSALTSTEPLACTVTVPNGERLVDGTGNYAHVRPGDTICLQAGARGELRLFNLSGTAERPVTVRNSGGSVEISASGAYAGIQIRNSSHLRVTGGGVEQQCGARFTEAEQRCGIRIAQSFNGLTGKVRTENLTVDHVEVGHVSSSGMGVYDKQLQRGEWVQRDIAFRDIYLHDIATEGHYHGSSDYVDGTSILLAGVEISRNLVVRTGRDGIQVGSAPWRCSISHNVVRDSGLNRESSHAFGIIVNRGAACDLEGNTISGSAGDGLYDQGLHGQRIVNNLVIRSGRFQAGTGINVREGNQSPTNPETPDYPRSTRIWHNTIVTTTDRGIRLGNTAGKANHLSNNIVTGAAAGTLKLASGVTATRLGNVLQPTNPRFLAPAADDYRLQPSSPAATAGATVPVLTDLLSKPRPVMAPSAGAYQASP